MKEAWHVLSSEGWHNVALGQLRDRQIEMAMDTIGQMWKKRIPIGQWLYDIFLHQLCEADELDEALNLLRQIIDVQQQRDAFPEHMWFFLLDQFSRSYHVWPSVLIKQISDKTSIRA